MYNETVTVDDQGDWSYSPLKYWPNQVTSANLDGKVSFLAYYPMAEAATNGLSLVDPSGAEFTAASSADPCVKYELGKDTDVDLMWGVETTAGTPHLNCTKATGEVAFDFKHALARVGFSVKLNSDITSAANETSVTINSIEFGGTIADETFTSVMHNSGVLNLNNGTKNIANWVSTDGTYKLELVTADFTDGGLFNDATLGNTITNKDEEYFMVIPQDLASAGAKMRITYTVKTIDDQLDLGYSEIKNIYVHDLTDNFENGKSYLYSYTIGIDAVELSGSVSAWEGITDSPLTVE